MNFSPSHGMNHAQNYLDAFVIELDIFSSFLEKLCEMPKKHSNFFSNFAARQISLWKRKKYKQKPGEKRTLSISEKLRP